MITSHQRLSHGYGQCGHSHKRLGVLWPYIRTSDLIFFNFGALTNFLHYITWLWPSHVFALRTVYTNQRVISPVYSDTTQLNPTSSWVELCRYKPGYRCRHVSHRKPLCLRNMCSKSSLNQLIPRLPTEALPPNTTGSSVPRLSPLTFPRVAIAFQTDHFTLLSCGRPIGRVARLARPSVCPSVLYGLLTRKRKT